MLSFLTYTFLYIATSTPQSKIEEVFGVNHPMVEVARCESGLIQFEAPNVVLRSKLGTPDVGIFQINIEYHGEQAKKLGMNVYSLEGNIAYAKYLYDKNGLRDWSASRACWKKGV